MEHIIQQLKKIGFGDYEAQIYAALRASSPASATSLAKQCNLSRSSVYTTLSSLIAKGLVGTTYRNEVKQFIAEDDAAIEQVLKSERTTLDEKFKTFDQLRSQLTAFSRFDTPLPQMTFFEGREGLKKIYLSMMRTAKPGSTLYLLRDEFVWHPDWKFIFDADWHDRVQRIKQEKNLTTQLLVNRSPVEKEHFAFYRSKKGLKLRFLPTQDSIHQFAIYILNEGVSILSFEHQNLIGIKIVNQHLAHNFQKMFQMMWDCSAKQS